MEFYEIDVDNLGDFIAMVTEALAKGKQKPVQDTNQALADWEKEILAQEPIPFTCGDAAGCNECESPEEVLAKHQQLIEELQERLAGKQRENDRLTEANINYYHTIEVLSQRIEGMEAALKLAIQIADMD